MAKPQRKPARRARAPGQMKGLIAASASSSGQEADHFPFLRLPIEVQEMILKYLLVGSENSHMKSGERNPGVYFINNRKHLEEFFDSERSGFPSHSNRLGNVERMHVARTCKYLYTESLRVYFGENHFHFFDFYSMREFLVRIGHERRQYIKNITVDFDGRTRTPIKPTVRVLEDCSHLSELTIAVKCPQYTSWVYMDEKRKNLLKAGGFATLKKLKGLRKVIVTSESICGKPSCQTSCFKNATELEKVLNTAMCAPKKVIKPKRKYTKSKNADAKMKVAKEKSKVAINDEPEA